MKNIKLSGAWLVFIFVYFVYKAFTKTGVSSLEFSLSSFAIFGLSVVLMYSVAEVVFFLTNKKQIRGLLLGLFCGVYAILGFYHYKTTRYFDFAVVADHWMSIWRPGSFNESMKVLDSIFGLPDYVRTVIAVLVTYVLVQYDDKRKSGSKWYLASASLSFLYLMVVVVNPMDEFTSVAKSAFYRAFAVETKFQARYKPKVGGEFPLIHHFQSSHSPSVLPNIFFVFVESVNARFIEAKSPEGKEFTPYYNELVKQGMYFERFYAQSIQTGRAHFSSLCGLTPSIYGKEFERFPGKAFNCLPEILNLRGYFTIFSKANEDVNFDNTYKFTTGHGFQVMNSMSKGCQGEDKEICWGWGIPDNVFYKRFFSYLKNEAPANRPVFATLATISSHMPFNEVPEAERYIYKNPSNRLEYYSNALRVTDEYLKTFFEELKNSPYGKNSVVFVMGDHSFPMGEHGNFQNENFAFEENFRTPLLILDFRDKDKAVVQAKRVPEAYSQINLAATALDLAGISTDVHFQGPSLFAEAPSFVSLVQPYGGIYFAVIKYPYKYILYDRSEKEFIYDLSKDPQEEKNLIADWGDDELLGQFRHEVGKMWLNYDMMVQDRVWRPRASQTTSYLEN